MLEDLLTPIIHNLKGFDLIIIGFAAINFLVMIMVFTHAKKVKNTIYPVGYQPDDFNDNEKRQRTRAELKQEKVEMLKNRADSDKRYTWFVNTSSIFPLLGIVGTVLSLIPMVQGTENMEQNFYLALTSTFWGLAFAIVFKVFDSFLAPRVDLNIHGIDDYLQKIESELVETK